MSNRSIILTFTLACFATACVDGDVATAPEAPTPEMTSEPKGNFTCESLLETTCTGFIGDNAVTAIIEGMGTLTSKEEKALATTLDSVDVDVDVGGIINGVTVAILNYVTNNGSLNIGTIVVCINNGGNQGCFGS